LKESAKQFEALFINMMLQSMRQATPKGNLLESHDQDIYTSMLDQQLSQNLAQRGMGLADMMLNQLKNLNAVPPQPILPAVEGAAPVIADIAPAVEGAIPAVAGAAQVQALAPLTPFDPVKTTIFEPTSRPATANSAPRSVENFHAKMHPHAVEASRITGIPPDFILGQAALESGWGKREIKLPDGSSSHNLFGIKAGASWKGKVAEVTTTEYTQGVPEKVVARFRAYDSDAEAFRDYAALLQNNPRYEQVIANGQSVSGFAQGIQKSGYATDPAYAAKLTSVIQRMQSVT
jgi:flagellar protein FlgJ